MKKAIIFDSYGTLVSTGNGSVTAAGEILKKINVDMDAKVFYKKWKEFHKQQIMEIVAGKPFITEEKIFENDLKMLYEFYNLQGNYKEDVQIMLDTLGKRKVFEETNEVLETLSQQYKIYIGSTTDTEPLMQDIKNNDMKLDGVYTSEILETYKPQKEFYTKILEEIHMDSNEVVFVGDSMDDDIIGPQSVGIQSILIDRKNRYDDEKKKIPDAVISDLRELKEVMKKI